MDGVGAAGGTRQPQLSLKVYLLFQKQQHKLVCKPIFKSSNLNEIIQIFSCNVVRDLVTDDQPTETTAPKLYRTDDDIKKDNEQKEPPNMNMNVNEGKQEQTPSQVSFLYSSSYTKGKS